MRLDWKIRRDDVFKLISHYKQHKCLWDFRSNEYKRLGMKRSAWTQLARIFGRDVHQIKKKIKHLRSAYVSEKKRVDDSLKNGSNENHQPSLFYYNNFKFLDSVIVLRKGVQSYNFESDPIATNDKTQDEPDITFVSKEYDCMEQAISPVSSPVPVPDELYSTQVQKRKLKKLAPYHSMLSSAVSSLTEIAQNASPEESIYTSFGKTVALQLSQLPPLQATSTMSEIHQLLSNNIIQYMLSKNREPRGINGGMFEESTKNGL